MNQYQTFVFDDYHFDPATRVLELHYALDDALHFTEKFRFDFEYAAHDPKALDRAIQTLFFMAGVSYYKKFLPPTIVINKGALDAEMAAFFSKTYQRGLGEFWYVNKLDPRTPVNFPANAERVEPLEVKETPQGLLVAIGGGKDSLVSVEILRQSQPVTTWSLNHRPLLTPLVERIGLPHAWVERELDPQLMTLKGQSYSGHVPISGIIAAVGIIVAILSGNRDVVVSNEQSANEPTLQYQGVSINHQYSKSQEFEQDFQAYLAHALGDSARYYSFLRPLTEMRIAELFAKMGFEKYQGVFSSCNRAFVHTSDHLNWCGECSKCAFIYMVLTPFISAEDLNALWHGKNLLLDPALEPTYRKLLGIEGDKPLDCVGEIKESRAAMRLAQEKYPALKEKYQFDLPEAYDWRQLATHEMPADVFAILQQALATA